MSEQEWVKDWEEYSDRPDKPNQSQKDNKEPRSPSVFLKESSELFTIIGVFAAVAFYFVQFKDIPMEEIQAGLVSSLVIFIIVGLVTINHALAEASRALEAESGFLTATYAILGACLIGLLFSIYNALNYYAPSINPALAMFASIAIGIFYLVGMFTDTELRQHDGWWVSELLIHYSPHLGTLLGTYWAKGSQNQSGETIFQAADGNVLALTFALILIHISSTFAVVIAANLVERVRSHLHHLQIRL